VCIIKVDNRVIDLDECHLATLNPNCPLEIIDTSKEAEVKVNAQV